MNKNLFWKFVLIVVLIALSIQNILPFEAKLKKGLDLAGGTSLLYEIDTSGLESYQKRNIAQVMIRILRERIDPGNISNLVWRPHGSNRIEIQMPLATEKQRKLRQEYQDKLASLESRNLNMRQVQQALIQPAGVPDEQYLEQRQKTFGNLAGDSKARQDLLEKLARIHDDLRQARAQQARALEMHNTNEEKLSEARINKFSVDRLYGNWQNLDDPNRVVELKKLAGGDQAKQVVIGNYIRSKKVVDDARNLITAQDGLDEQYNQAREEIENANIDIERLKKFLAAKSHKRNEEITRLKESHPLTVALIDEVVVAYDVSAKTAGRLDDPEDLKRKLRGSGILEFRILPQTNEESLTEGEITRYREDLEKYGPKRASGKNYVWQKIKSPEDFQVQSAILGEFADDKFVLTSNKDEETLLHEGSGDTWRLTDARIGNDDIGNWAVNFQFNEIGANRFFPLTKNNLNRPLCILLDKEAISAPNINSPIRNRGQITGTFTQTEVQDLVDKLNAGSLPARLGDQPISENNIGPSLGRDNLQAGLKAGIFGLLAVAAFMVLYYLIAGSLAGLALFMNLLLVVSVMAFSQATFTLPGIAGLILTIGMAVDANVLIFERIREEQQRGSSLRMAIKNGYDRAFRTIMDANLTTFMVALILWFLASEEVKGFALTLMIGLVSSMFTALFVTRTIFNLLTSLKLISKKLVMMQLIHKPQVNWLAGRPIFWVFSAILVLGGWAVFLNRDEAKNSKYSIEFTGGTSIQVKLNQTGTDMTRADVQNEITEIGAEMKNPFIEAAKVTQIGSPDRHEFEIVTTATSRTEIDIRLPAQKSMSAPDIQTAVHDAAVEVGDRRMENAEIIKTDTSGNFKIITDQVNPNIINSILKKALPENSEIVSIATEEIVGNAVRKALGDKLDVLNDLEPDPASMKTQPITDELISQKLYLSEYKGGLLLSCSFGRGKAETLERLDEKRFSQLKFKTEFEKYGNNPFQLFAPNNNGQPNESLTGLEVAVLSPDIIYGDPSQVQDWNTFVGNEREKFESALRLTSSFTRNTQIDPSVGEESMNAAMIAIFFSLLAVVAYIWIRFGNVRFGMAAVAALIHDVSVAMGLVAASAWLSETALGRALLISDFKIDLPMIAGFLTVIGYSLNDTIVVFDRIRENRGKMATLSVQVINDSINQTISRTILTSATTLIVLIVMYIWGGTALRGFNYVLIIGVIVGTYSSIGIAAPLLFGAKHESHKNNKKTAPNNKKS